MKILCVSSTCPANLQKEKDRDYKMEKNQNYSEKSTLWKASSTLCGKTEVVQKY